ncbi:hypothetical protein EYF80_028532 [Liparis tanakae]|uniref:Uncharacterized protein n=1 Tax=Liparis tanakae TaxID=230148 RepID=A0A4Z2H5T5_9TELE|nr:hypothetical protein EYF80_028532 [Liparis tanakae]
MVNQLRGDSFFLSAAGALAAAASLLVFLCAAATSGALSFLFLSAASLLPHAACLSAACLSAVAAALCPSARRPSLEDALTEVSRGAAPDVRPGAASPLAGSLLAAGFGGVPGGEETPGGGWLPEAGAGPLGAGSLCLASCLRSGDGAAGDEAAGDRGAAALGERGLGRQSFSFTATPQLLGGASLRLASAASAGSVDGSLRFGFGAAAGAFPSGPLASVFAAPGGPGGGSGGGSGLRSLLATGTFSLAVTGDEHPRFALAAPPPSGGLICAFSAGRVPTGSGSFRSTPPSVFGGEARPSLSPGPTALLFLLQFWVTLFNEATAVALETSLLCSAFGSASTRVTAAHAAPSSFRPAAPPPSADSLPTDLRAPSRFKPPLLSAFEEQMFNSCRAERALSGGRLGALASGAGVTLELGRRTLSKPPFTASELVTSGFAFDVACGVTSSCSASSS